MSPNTEKAGRGNYHTLPPCTLCYLPILSFRQIIVKAKTAIRSLTLSPARTSLSTGQTAQIPLVTSVTLSLGAGFLRMSPKSGASRALPEVQPIVAFRLPFSGPPRARKYGNHTGYRAIAWGISPSMGAGRVRASLPAGRGSGHRTDISVTRTNIRAEKEPRFRPKETFYHSRETLNARPLSPRMPLNVLPGPAPG